MKGITPFLWFDTQAEAAVNLYTSVFKNSKVKDVLHYDEASAKASGQPEGSVLTISFELDGRDFVALNGGPMFRFTEAVSFAIECENQEEVDYYWERLTADGGEEGMCGWLKDKFGVSWQVTPTALMEMLSHPDHVKAGRAMEAMLEMKKIDIGVLRRAFEGA